MEELAEFKPATREVILKEYDMNLEGIDSDVRMLMGRVGLSDKNIA